MLKQHTLVKLSNEELSTLLQRPKMDFEAIFAAVDPNVFEWAVVELDNCATDMFTALAMSYNYLIKNNMATGNV